MVEPCGGQPCAGVTEAGGDDGPGSVARPVWRGLVPLVTQAAANHAVTMLAYYHHLHTGQQSEMIDYH